MYEHVRLGSVTPPGFQHRVIIYAVLRPDGKLGIMLDDVWISWRPNTYDNLDDVMAEITAKWGGDPRFNLELEYE